jgi:hypothetical protein
MTWQCFQTSDSATKEEAEATFDAAFPISKTDTKPATKTATHAKSQGDEKRDEDRAGCEHVRPPGSGEAGVRARDGGRRGRVACHGRRAPGGRGDLSR